MTKKRINVGTIGHIGGGNVTLTAAIATILAAESKGTTMTTNTKHTDERAELMKALRENRLNYSDQTRLAALLEADAQAKGREAVGRVHMWFADGHAEWSFEPSPSAWTLSEYTDEARLRGIVRSFKVYTTPPAQPAREWVELSVEEIEPLWHKHCHAIGPIALQDLAFARAVIAAEREKNSGQSEAALHCVCDACKGGVLHWSDCAVHNMPAYPSDPCDCGAAQPVKEN